MADWQTKRVLVTGATGFIGTHLTRLLLQAGAEVWAGVFDQEPAERVRRLDARTKRVTLDLRQPQSVAAAVTQCAPQVVFHLAAVGVIAPNVPPTAALEANTAGTVYLLDALHHHGVERVVLAGTCHEYGRRETDTGLDPANFYAASKVAAWAFARAFWRAHRLPVVVARLFQVYGPGQPATSLVPAAIHAALSGGDMEMTPGKQVRDLVFVQDIAAGFMALAAAPDIAGQSFDLGTGRGHAVREVVERVWAMTDAPGRILAGARPYRDGEAMRLVADAARTASLTGWQAQVELENGLQLTIDDLRSRRQART